MTLSSKNEHLSFFYVSFVIDLVLRCGSLFWRDCIPSQTLLIVADILIPY